MQTSLERPDSVASKLAADLRADILSGVLPIGHRIACEHELMGRFSVSRQTVREALRELGAEGLVLSRRGPGGGAFVAAPDLARISELMTCAGRMLATSEQFTPAEVCVATFHIEAACCRLAAQRRDPAAIAEMRQAIENAALAPRALPAFFDAQTAFNHALWTAAGNEPLAFIMRGFMGSLRESLPYANPMDWDEIAGFLRSNHSAILAGIEAGDGERAVEHLKDYLAFWLSHPWRVRA